MPKIEIRHDSFKAGADLRTKQFYCVELTAENTIGLCNAAADLCIGILMTKPNTGEPGRVALEGRIPAVSDGSGTAIAVGDWVGPNTSGKVVKKATAAYATIGIALQASSTDGAVIDIDLRGPDTYVAPLG